MEEKTHLLQLDGLWRTSRLCGAVRIVVVGRPTVGRLLRTAAEKHAEEAARVVLTLRWGLRLGLWLYRGRLEALRFGPVRTYAVLGLSLVDWLRLVGSRLLLRISLLAPAPLLILIGIRGPRPSQVSLDVPGVAHVSALV